ISDFISMPGWAEPLTHLAQRHEIVAVRLYDPLEVDLPDLGLLVMRDAETGEQLFVDTHDRAFRKRFAAVAERREEELRSALRQAGVDALELSTNDDLVDAVLRFADLRKRRRQLAAGGSLPQHLRGRHDVSMAGDALASPGCAGTRCRVLLPVAPEKGGRAQVCQLEHGKGGDGRGLEIALPHYTVAFPGCALPDDPCDCPSGRRYHLAIPTPNHHP